MEKSNVAMVDASDMVSVPKGNADGSFCGRQTGRQTDSCAYVSSLAVVLILLLYNYWMVTHHTPAADGAKLELQHAAHLELLSLLICNSFLSHTIYHQFLSTRVCVCLHMHPSLVCVRAPNTAHHRRSILHILL